MPEEEPLVQLARKSIEELNEKYRSSQRRYFLPLSCARRWNPVEAIWMGYEPEHGKLAELNALLAAAPRSVRTRHRRGGGRLGGVKYVITLDTDTQLPRDSAGG